MSPEQIDQLFSLAIGFAIAGLLASAYQLVTARPASFRLLQRGPSPATFAAVPLLVFAAPFIIMRNSIRGRRISHGRRLPAVTAARQYSRCGRSGFARRGYSNPRASPQLPGAIFWRWPLRAASSVRNGGIIRTRRPTSTSSGSPNRRSRVALPPRGSGILRDAANCFTGASAPVHASLSS